jgi:hypothetical protein
LQLHAGAPRRGLPFQDREFVVVVNDVEEGGHVGDQVGRAGLEGGARVQGVAVVGFGADPERAALHEVNRIELLPAAVAAGGPHARPPQLCLVRCALGFAGSWGLLVVAPGEDSHPSPPLCASPPGPAGRSQRASSSAGTRWLPLGPSLSAASSPRSIARRIVTGW